MQTQPTRTANDVARGISYAVAVALREGLMVHALTIPQADYNLLQPFLSPDGYIHNAWGKQLIVPKQA